MICYNAAQREVSMVKKLGFLLCFFVSVPALAITRTVECTSNEKSDRFLTILLRAGNARIFECEGGPCQFDHGYLQTGVLSGSTENSVSYRVVEGNYPAVSNFEIRFPDEVDGPVELLIDGRGGEYSCI